MKMRQRLAGAACCVALLAPFAALAVADAQIDTFESGTSAGWTAGQAHPGAPQNVATGGPDGVDDNYLQVSSTAGFGPGSRLAMFNAAQWSGDYTAAGVGAILMDVNNLGPNDISLRLLFADALPTIATHSAMTTDAVVVPSGSGWVTVLIPIAASELTALVGTAGDALSGATHLWMVHNDAVGFPPPIFTASLGVDNIEALPEPSAAAALAAGFALLACLGRARAKRS